VLHEIDQRCGEGSGAWPPPGREFEDKKRIRIQLDKVPTKNCWHILDEHCACSVDPMWRDKDMDATEAHYSLSIVDGQPNLFSTHVDRTYSTCHALPQQGFSNRCVMCKVMRMTGSSSSFSSKSGSSFLTFSLAVWSPLRKRFCMRYNEQRYSAGFSLSKHISSSCD
jgi:hypothetical protein